MMAPVGQASRQPARWQCLQTSDISSQEKSPSPVSWPVSGTGRSMNETCRQVEAPRAAVLSYDMPVKSRPSSGSWFHSLQATSQALQPMQIVLSVKKPTAISGLLVLSNAGAGEAMPARGLLSHDGQVPAVSPIAADVSGQRGHQRSAGHHPPAAAASAGLDVARQGLRLLDRHVGVR